jgi:hypothetical protein
MANSVITTDIFAKAAVATLENALQASTAVYRGLESEFNNVNGYLPGATVSIRRPADFTVRVGAAASVQDVVEGSTSITVDTQIGSEFAFTSADLTMDIRDMQERIIKPQMIQLANYMDADILGMYKSVPNWAGTPGQTINAFSDFAKGPERMDELAIPTGSRKGFLSPADNWGMVGSQTGLYIQGAANDAYRRGSLGEVGGVDTYMSQNVATHTVGVATGTPLVNGAAQNTTWALTKDSGTQSLATDGWTNSTTGILKQGDVFTIAGVYAVNPVSKATLPFLRQFVVMADADSGASTGPATLTISPPIITSGSQQTCSAAPADGAAITVMGTGGTGYRQNLLLAPEAFALAVVPMIKPEGAVGVSRQSFNGISVRVIPYYTGSSDVSSWRLDVLYGKKVLDPRKAVRLSGTA